MPSDPARPAAASRPAPRRQRHLLDPADLASSHRRSQGTTRSLERVQRLVLTFLVVTTVLHLSAGFSIAAIAIDESATAARVVMTVIAAFTGLVAVGAARVIHGRPVLSPWLLLGLVLPTVGAYLTFLR